MPPEAMPVFGPRCCPRPWGNAEIQVDVYILCHCQTLGWCPRALLPRGAIWIGVACLHNWSHIAAHGPCSLWGHEWVDGPEIAKGPCWFTATQNPVAAGPMGQTVPWAAAWARTSPGPQVAQATHTRPLLTILTSPVLPLFTVHRSLHFSVSLVYLSVSHLLITVVPIYVVSAMTSFEVGWLKACPTQRFQRKSIPGQS